VVVFLFSEENKFCETDWSGGDEPQNTNWRNQSVCIAVVVVILFDEFPQTKPRIITGGLVESCSWQNSFWVGLSPVASYLLKPIPQNNKRELAGSLWEWLGLLLSDCQAESGFILFLLLLLCCCGWCDFLVVVGGGVLYF